METWFCLLYPINLNDLNWRNSKNRCFYVVLTNIFKYRWNSFTHRVCSSLHKSLVLSTSLQKCPPVRDAALAISRKDDHSACIYRDFTVGQHFCVTHLPAYCHQNAVRNRCARDLLEPRFNNKSECWTLWQMMYRFQ